MKFFLKILLIITFISCNSEVKLYKSSYSSDVYYLKSSRNNKPNRPKYDPKKLFEEKKLNKNRKL
jgi:hypothetical protein